MCVQILWTIVLNSPLNSSIWLLFFTFNKQLTFWLLIQQTKDSNNLIDKERGPMPRGVFDVRYPTRRAGGTRQGGYLTLNNS
jgi:hypothetical protein